MEYKEIDWTQKSEDDIYDYYDNLELEEKYPFFKELCLQKEGLDFDWFSMLGDRHELIPKENMAVCEDFVTWFPEKFPQEYAEDFPFVEKDLCSYYLFKGDLPKLRERIAVVADDPITGIDTVTLKLYYQLIYHGYREEAVAYAEKIFVPVHQSPELIGRSEGIFVQGIYFNALQQSYEKYKQTGLLDYSELKKLLPKYDLKEEAIEATIESTALQNELDADAVLAKFKSNYLQGFISLKMHFLKYMYEQYQTPFMLSEEIWDVVSVKDIFGQSEDPDASYFYMDTRKLDKILNERIDHFMGSNQLEMFGKVWGLFYVVEFLEAKSLISEEEAIRMQENATYFRNRMMLEVGDELWKMNFVFKWPGSERWKDLKLIVESTYIQMAQDANKMIRDFIKSQPVNKRIDKELAIEEKLMRQDFFNPNKEPYVKSEPKVGRNDPCPCGSGKKYKKCCMNK